MDVFVETILPVLTLVLGAVLTQVNTSRVEKAQLRREKLARDEARKHVLLDRREDFELIHLNELYSALGELEEAALVYKAVWETKAPNLREVAGRCDEADRRVRRLAGLVLPDDTRELVKKAYDALSESRIPSELGGTTSMAPWNQAALQVRKAQSEIASRIRDVHKREPSGQVNENPKKT